MKIQKDVIYYRLPGDEVHLKEINYCDINLRETYFNCSKLLCSFRKPGIESFTVNRAL